MLVAIALEPEPLLARRFAGFRARYDPDFELNSPEGGGGAHITLKRPVRPCQPLDALIERFRLLGAAIELPVAVEAGGLSIYHSPGASAIFWRVAIQPALLALHHYLREGLAGYLEEAVAFEGDYYMAHMTLANNLSDIQLARAVTELTQPAQRLLYRYQRFSCPILSLAVREETQEIAPWQRLAVLAPGLH